MTRETLESRRRPANDEYACPDRALAILVAVERGWNGIVSRRVIEYLFNGNRLASQAFRVLE